jgi:hypothetical protein
VLLAIWVVRGALPAHDFRIDVPRGTLLCQEVELLLVSEASC